MVGQLGRRLGLGGPSSPSSPSNARAQGVGGDEPGLRGRGGHLGPLAPAPPWPRRGGPSPPRTARRVMRVADRAAAAPSPRPWRDRTYRARASARASSSRAVLGRATHVAPQVAVASRRSGPRAGRGARASRGGRCRARPGAGRRLVGQRAVRSVGPDRAEAGSPARSAMAAARSGPRRRHRPPGLARSVPTGPQAFSGMRAARARASARRARPRARGHGATSRA